MALSLAGYLYKKAGTRVEDVTSPLGNMTALLVWMSVSRGRSHKAKHIQQYPANTVRVTWCVFIFLNVYIVQLNVFHDKVLFSPIQRHVNEGNNKKVSERDYELL